MKYRVWCLSWEDTDEDGRDVVGVDVAREVTPAGCIAAPYYVADAREAATYYAEWAHSNRDGWECTWPLTFRVRLPDGSTEDYEVEREYDPTFRARQVINTNTGSTGPEGEG